MLCDLGSAVVLLLAFFAILLLIRGVRLLYRSNETEQVEDPYAGYITRGQYGPSSRMRQGAR
jgi:hypothetical protein